MKRLVYIISAFLMIFTACQEEMIDRIDTNEETTELVKLQFSMDIPEFTVVTRAANDFKEAPISTVMLLTFDKDGVFLGKASGEQTSGNTTTGTAVISTKTRIIHFLVNYENWETDKAKALATIETDDDLIGIAHEESLIPFLETKNLGYWGRIEVTREELNKTLTPTLIRNFAKISFGESDYTIVNFGIVNRPTVAKVATYNEWKNVIDNEEELKAKLFEPNDEERLTVPSDQTYTNDNDPENVLVEDIHMFESENFDDDAPVHVVVQIDHEGSLGKRFYRLQLKKSAVESWKIERNFHYKIVLGDFTPETSTGYATYTEAANGSIANDLDAEIIRDSPGVTDSYKNRLEVEKVVYHFPASGKLIVKANYFVDGVKANEYIDVRVKQEDDNKVISNCSYDENYEGGSVLADVIKPTSGEGEATIVVYEKNRYSLKREIRVIVKEGYEFSDFSYSYEDDNDPENNLVNVNFTIPEDFDTGLLPSIFYIKTNNLIPVDGLLVETKDGDSYYGYEVTTIGVQTVSFYISRYEDEVITLHNDYFKDKSASFECKDKLVSFSNGMLMYYDLTEEEFLPVTGMVKMETGSDYTKNIEFVDGLPTQRVIPVSKDESSVTFTYNESSNEFLIENMKKKFNKLLLTEVEGMEWIIPKGNYWYHNTSNGANKAFDPNTQINVTYKESQDRDVHFILGDAGAPNGSAYILLPDDVTDLKLWRIVESNNNYYELNLTLDVLLNESKKTLVRIP